MAMAYEGTGTVTKDGVIRLDDRTGLPRGRVRVIVEPEVTRQRGSIFDIPPPQGGGRSAEELLSELRALRDEWDEEE